MKVLFFIVLGLLVACGKKEGDDSINSVTTLDEQFNEPSLDGNYRAVIRPINTTASKIVSGAADIKIAGDQVTINLVVDDAPTVKHIQTIRSGTSCNLNGDSNQDGLVDAIEAEGHAGEPLISLDNDIDSTFEVNDHFPQGSSYTYSETGSVSAIQNRLGRPLVLEGKIIIIHGVSDMTPLPVTVQGKELKSAHLELPIACGIIERVEQ